MKTTATTSIRVCVECRGRERDTCIPEQECTDRRNTAWASAGDRCVVLTGTFFASITSANVLRSSYRYQAHRLAGKENGFEVSQPPIPDQTRPVVNPTNKPSTEEKLDHIPFQRASMPRSLAPPLKWIPRKAYWNATDDAFELQ